MLQSTNTTQLPLPSNQKFGWLFTAVFAVGGAYAYWKDASTLAIALGGLAAVFAVITIVSPSLLAPLNRLWFELGILLGKVVSPIVLGIIFFLLITPVSLVTRMFGRDALLIKKRDVKSYWVERSPAGPAPDSFRNQF